MRTRRNVPEATWLTLQMVGTKNNTSDHGGCPGAVLDPNTPQTFWPLEGGHEATDTGLAYAPVSQAHGHHHTHLEGRRGGGLGQKKHPFL